MPATMLLIAPQVAAEPVAEALREQLGVVVEIAPHRRSGLAALRKATFSVVLLEEWLAQMEQRETELLYQNAGVASLLEVDFGEGSSVRIVRQVRAELARRGQDAETARAAAVVTLQNELSSALTGLLLEAQLALREAPAAMQPKLRHLVTLAGNLRTRLRP